MARTATLRTVTESFLDVLGLFVSAVLDMMSDCEEEKKKKERNE